MADGKIQRCLDSLVAQSIINNKSVDFEVIAIDDCSTDGTMDVLKSYEEKYKGILYVYKTERNHKQGGARNLGLLKSSGDYICFIDADDWVAPMYVERLLNEALETGSQIVSCNYCLKKNFSFTVTEYVDICKNNFMIDFVSRKRNALLNDAPCWNKIYERKFLLGDKSNENYCLFPEDMAFEDNATMIPLLLKLQKYSTIPDVLYFYYQNPSSTIHTFSWQKIWDRINAGLIMIKNSQQHHDYAAFESEIKYRFIEMFYINTYSMITRQIKCLETKKAFLELSSGIKQYCLNWKKNKYYRESLKRKWILRLTLLMYCPYIAYHTLFFCNLWDFFIRCLKFIANPRRIFNKIRTII